MVGLSYNLCSFQGDFSFSSFLLTTCYPSSFFKMIIKSTELNKGNISNFLSKYAQLLKDIQAYTPDTLFPYYWDNLEKGRCVKCGNKLKFIQRSKIWICNSIKHGKSPFIIKNETMAKLGHLTELKITK